MYVPFLTLMQELARCFQVQTFQIPQEQIITDIEMLPVSFDPYRDTPEKDTLYLCEFWQLKRFDPHAELPPILCVVESSASPSAVLYVNRCMAVVYGSTLMDVLLGLTNSAYNLGCKSSIITEVSRNFLQCTSMEELLAEGYRALKNPLVITDYRQRIIYSVDPNLISSPIYRNILATEYLPVGHPTISTSGTSWNAIDVPFTVGKNQDELFPVICKPLQVGTATLGYLHILQFSHEFDEQDASIAELLGNLFTVELWKKKRTDLRSQEAPDIRFFRKILDNRLGDDTAILEEQQKLKLTLKPHQFAMVFNVRKTENITSQNRILFSDLADMIRTSLLGAHAFVYKNSVFTVVETDTEVLDFDAYLAPIAPAIKQNHLVVGISNEMPGIAQLREAGYQCRKAMQLGAALHPDVSVYHYRDYILYYMMELALKDEDTMALCPPALRKLMEYCSENGSELLDTLKIYLNCGRSKSAAAKEMYVHVNTVKYRIAQIQELTGLDISDDNTAFELMVAFRMFEYREKFSKYEPIYNPEN